ncbi:Probable transcriptional regulatory protein YebC [Klebsiella pneumoniae]|uniref:Probable transcriptional regulatory protein YebC n=1 Tax=Klebsiella pneumoniae TaxID=573 RepID=A0A4P0YA95_KLEPN|nr:Probable transcriptional regulatory protein YebC [Klebsiella pneumoniae]
MGQHQTPQRPAQDPNAVKSLPKIIRELVTAARLGGGDPASNPRLACGR